MGIKLAISNIAWSPENSRIVYEYMKATGFHGLEIAPTILFPDKPYEKKAEAKEYAEWLNQAYKLRICSMQSIWFGHNEKIFGSEEERNTLTEYTRRAIDFAEVINAGNLVFGCPKNRCIRDETDYDIAVKFFRELGDYAVKHNTVLSMEANPVIYGTNFINRTLDAIQLIEEVDSEGFKLNLDFGTITYNGESMEELIPYLGLINHVHISEPKLKTIERRKDHEVLMNLLRGIEYDGYVSIEMGKQDDIKDVFKVIDYIVSL